jgi:diguanylate cyclase (GGDEF)-like protein
MRVSLAGNGARLDASLLALPRRTALLTLYTVATIALGLGALAVATPLVPLWYGIAVPGVDPAMSRAAGLGAWILFGLLGGTRMLRDPGGHVVLTFHMPFIVAATLLGGPVAGAWVALLATFDRRELREAPWYGVLANHAGIALAALIGGSVTAATLALGRAVGLSEEPAVDLVGAVAGTIVLAAVSASIAGGVAVLRDGLTPREAAIALDRPFRATAAAELLLGWLFVVAWVAVGWWTPALLTVIVLSLWRGSRAVEQLNRDELTGVMSGRAFALRTAEAAARARRGIEGSAYLFLDLDGFKAVNDGPRSHRIGDQVLVEVGRRLQRSVRVTDAVGRRGGDEFMVLFAGVGDEASAVALATRIHEAVTAPYDTDDGEHMVGASIGVALLVPGRRDFEPDVREHADAAMYAAKAAGGGVRAWEEPSTPG